MIYDFKCNECGQIEENVTLSIHHIDADHPPCCGGPMRHYLTTLAGVHWRDRELLDGGFIAHSMPGRPVITSQRQNRELMRRHNLIDANDLGPPPTKAQQIAQNQIVDPYAPPAHVLKELKRQGHDAILP